MGRRSRRRTIAAEVRPAARIARVRIDDATWDEFKRAIGDSTVAEVLGRYVELEVSRARAARLRESDVTQREVLDALERARLTAEALQRITRRLEVLVRRPT